tara:strand:- start:356 stop:631 length:276 start_codon:yes stop_codon:yes gene_type:complete
VDAGVVADIGLHRYGLAACGVNGIGHSFGAFEKIIINRNAALICGRSKMFCDLGANALTSSGDEAYAPAHIKNIVHNFPLAARMARLINLS